MTVWVWVGILGCLIGAGLVILGFVALWRPGPPLDDDPGASWLAGSGERPYVGKRRDPEGADHADQPTALEPTGHADEYQWDPRSAIPPRDWQRPPWA